MDPVTWLAAGAAALAVSIVWRPAPTGLAGLAGPGGLSRTRAAPLVGALVGLGGAAVLFQWGAGLPAATPGVALVALVGSVGGWRWWRGRGLERERLRTAAQVRETCEHLAADLAAGQPPDAALARCADDWPALAAVVAAQRMGADVPTAWRELARAPGAQDLTVVAAAWQVAHGTGAGLADTLSRVAAGLRSDAATARVVNGELASARATAQMMAGLPVAMLLLGSGVGGSPWAFLLATPVGWVCLALGLGLAWAGLTWIEALARGVRS